MRYSYPADVLEEADGVTVTFPDVPHAVTNGQTRAEALEHARDALVSGLSFYVDDGLPVPRPSAAAGRVMVSVTTLEAAKLALHDVMISAHMSNVDLARQLGLHERAVRRLRDSLHRSHVGQIEVALRTLGKRLEVDVQDRE